MVVPANRPAGEELSVKAHIVLAMEHMKLAGEKTSDPGLQGDLERARAKLQRRIDQTDGR